MNPTADWEKLGERYYRKVQLYTEVFDQDLELENHIVTGAPYGGAIGMFIFAKLSFRVFDSMLLVYLPPYYLRPPHCPLTAHLWFGQRTPSIVY